MTTPTTGSTTDAAVTARLASPANRTPAGLVTATSAQLAAVMACPDYANQAALQAVVKVSLSDNALLSQYLDAYEKAKAALPGLEATFKKQMAIVRRDRHNVSGALTTACNGVPASIVAYGAIPSDTHTPLPPASTAPPNLVLMSNSAKTAPGTIKAKCTAIPGAASYFWTLSTDPTALPTTTPSIMTTGSRVSITGQTVGHVVYLRVSVLRRRSGQSPWSDALQITVR